MKAILETEPQPMSRAIGREGPRRVLQGDLDTIVAKALRKAPEDRYLSARDLAEDIRLHLAHEPIHARPLSVAGRFFRILRRHRWWVASVLVMVSLSIVLPAGQPARAAL